MAKYKDTDYLHISSRVRMLENKLFGRDAYEKIIEAQSPEDAVRVLTDNGYESAESVGATAFEELLSKKQADVYAFLAENVCDVTLIDLFRVPYDYQNIKAALKCEYLGISPERLLFANGTIEKNTLVKAVTERDKSVLTSKMAAAVELAVEQYAKNGDPQQTDIICDRACYEELLEKSRASGFEFLYVYFTKKVDMLNISAFIRIRKMKKPYMFFERVFIPCEKGLKLSFFEDMFEKSDADFVEELSHGAYAPLASRLNPEKIDISEVSAAIDEYSERLINEFSLVAFGPQVPVGYLLSQDAEIGRLRVALSSKLAGVSAEKIRATLRL